MLFVYLYDDSQLLCSPLIIPDDAHLINLISLYVFVVGNYYIIISTDIKMSAIRGSPQNIQTRTTNYGMV